MASLKQTFERLKKGMTKEQAEKFDWMAKTAVDFQAVNTKNFASKTLAEFQLQELAKKALGKQGEWRS